MTPSHESLDASTGRPLRRIGVATGTLLVVANMIGTGVFTTTGFLIADIGSGPAVLAAWLVGGLAALFGALAYAELGAALPHNGGEYQLLSRIYHPALGFVAGWVALVVGFSAPLAASALAFGKYFNAVFPRCQAAAEALSGLISPASSPVPAAVWPGLVLLAFVSVLHAVHIGAGSRFQNAFTLGKVSLIVVFIAAGAAFCEPSRIIADSSASLATAIVSTPFAVGLVYISFAYSGWNAAAYLAGEFRNPERNVPLALLGGTVIVTWLYLGLNFIFLAAAPAAILAGKLEVGHVAAVSLFGEQAGRLFSGLIMLGLVSMTGALTMTGPRVYEAMGGDYPALRFLAIRRAEGGPVVAILVQSTLATVMMVTASFATLLTYIGLTLSLFTALTVLGVFVLRCREPSLNRPYHTWGYPFTPILCVALQSWMIVHAVIDKPLVALWGGVTLGAGFALYFIIRVPGRAGAQSKL